MRRKIKRRIKIEPDYLYGSFKVSKFINYIMECGKKNVARKIVYGILEDIKEKTGNEDPVKVLETAFDNVAPIMEVRSRRIGGATYQVPREVRPERRLMLAMGWILEAAQAKKGKPIKERLFDEIMAATKNEGDAMKKKENTHRMAEANRAFAHFSW